MHFLQRKHFIELLRYSLSSTVLRNFFASTVFTYRFAKKVQKDERQKKSKALHLFARTFFGLHQVSNAFLYLKLQEAAIILKKF